MRFAASLFLLLSVFDGARAQAPNPANSKSIKTFINCINDALIVAPGAGLFHDRRLQSIKRAENVFHRPACCRENHPVPTHPARLPGPLTGWSVGDTPNMFTSSFIPHSGTWAAALGSVDSGLGILSQDLTTVAGGIYRLSYWLYSIGDVPNSFSAQMGQQRLPR